MHSMQTLEDKVIAKIYGRGRGWAFTPKEFASLGDARSVGMALTRLTRKGPFGVSLADSMNTHAKTLVWDCFLLRRMISPKPSKEGTIPAFSLPGPMQRIFWGFPTKYQ
jgi:hypothetical protein